MPQTYQLHTNDGVLGLKVSTFTKIGVLVFVLRIPQSACLMLKSHIWKAWFIRGSATLDPITGPLLFSLMGFYLSSL
jgi:hypothetical protein